MSAFISPTPLLHRRQSSSLPPPRPRAVPRAAAPSHLALDPLHSFHAFCRRAQHALASHAARVDGLGTFTPPPHTVRHADHCSHRLEMRGGRAFRAAVLDVWSSAHVVPVRRKRLLTCIDTRGHMQYLKEGVGLSLNLEPRDPSLPCLRADAHYFQIGGGRVAWWFAGNADLSLADTISPNVFSSLVAPFFHAWQRLIHRHRIDAESEKRAFLEACISIGEMEAAHRLDRNNSFNFITQMVDTLLPVYLPLIQKHPLPQLSFDPFHNGKALNQQTQTAFGVMESVQTFRISGGAACETTTLRANPLASCRFSLAPSSMTSAGRVYDTLRTNTQGACQSLLYIDTL